ncbi:MAG: STAS domain-containing protein [Acidobacteria bacterium]|nr:MAG: STAS domain-containing protein [Acidobacteriota bacterium]REJ99257.1 MAG: STAS domain-containing protein [Acidobacteriota bacterium]REK16022.1 MAG: STAS domain-containing protein [Acidobacteriota bacterium]REK43703.1 MAG: STAS domain-containing protein [Acidobacteriota bacterium]
MTNSSESILKRLLPSLDFLEDYDRRQFSRDLFAGVTVAVVLIPQVMAYAILAGLPPVYGLYAALLGTAAAAIWGSSRQLSTGPVALVSFLVLSALVPVAKPESAEYIALAVILALLIGLVQLMMGLFRLGFLMTYISHSVIAGFTTAAAIIIATTQIPTIFGFSIESREAVFLNVIEIARKLPETHLPTLILGLSSVLLVIFLKKRVSRSFPSALVAVGAGILISYFLDLRTAGVAVVGQIDASLTLPTFPEINLDQLFSLLPSALVISVVGFLEAYAISKAIASKTKQRLDVNKELIGQGVGNLASSVLKGYPVAGSFSRTAVNFSAGGETAVSSVFVSLFVLITILFLTPLLYFLPRAVLGAIVIAALVDLIEFSKFRETFKLSGSDGIVITVTFLFAFVMRPENAIFIGILVSLILFLRKTIAARVVPCVFHFDEERFYQISEDNRVKQFAYVMILRVDMSIFFANANNIAEQIEDLAEEMGDDLKYIVINFSGVNYIDVSGCDVMGELFEELTAKGITIYSMYRKHQVREIMKKSGVDKYLTPLHDIKGFKHEFIIQKNLNIA